MHETKPLRILLAGNYSFPCYEKACADALDKIGCDVIRFSWSRYFIPLRGRIENYFAWSGPATRAANRELIDSVRQCEADAVIVWRGTHVDREALRHIRRQNPHCILVSNNNDDPFSMAYTTRRAPVNQRRLWKRFRQAIPEYDLNFVYRPVNVAEYIEQGGRDVRILMPYFVPELTRPYELTREELDRYGCDVVFIGHYEADGRERYLRALAKAGLKVRLFGHDWPDDITRKIPGLPKIYPVYGDEYAKALCGAKMCLCFLSRLNRDVYTRRSFEIPACGCLMLSERTQEMTNLFREDRDAVYFSDEKELVAAFVVLEQGA